MLVEQRTVDALVHVTGGPCVSVYCPIDRLHPDDHRDHTVFKSLVGSIRAQLEASGVPAPDGFDAVVAEVLERDHLASRTGTLAVFAAPGFTAELEVRGLSEPLAFVADRFHVVPLLADVDHALGAHVLVVGTEQIELFRVVNGDWVPCDVPGLPVSLEEALRLDRTGRHAGAYTTAGRSVVHGEGDQDEDRKDRINRFLHEVDEVAVKHLADHPRSALVVAGTAEIVSHFRSISHHANVIAAPVGSPGELTPAEIRTRVTPQLQALVQASDNQLVAELGSLLGTGRAASDPAELVAAASAGRAGALYVMPGPPVWVRPEAPGEVLGERLPGAVDVVNHVAVETLRHGGSVRVVPTAALPGGTRMFGVLRY